MTEPLLSILVPALFERYESAFPLVRRLEAMARLARVLPAFEPGRRPEGPMSGWNR